MQTFADGHGSFQHYHAPCHNSKLFKNFTKEQNLNVLNGPGNSSDLNPIEYLWSLVKRPLSKWTVRQNAVD